MANTDQKFVSGPGDELEGPPLYSSLNFKPELSKPEPLPTEEKTLPPLDTSSSTSPSGPSGRSFLRTVFSPAFPEFEFPKIGDIYKKLSSTKKSKKPRRDYIAEPRALSGRERESWEEDRKRWDDERKKWNDQKKEWDDKKKEWDDERRKQSDARAQWHEETMQWYDERIEWHEKRMQRYYERTRWYKERMIWLGKRMKWDDRRWQEMKDMCLRQTKMPSEDGMERLWEIAVKEREEMLVWWTEEVEKDKKELKEMMETERKEMKEALQRERDAWENQLGLTKTNLSA
ncbi:hypothetical protein FQN54_004237 [Arachnomyces sp. PD_36]|nr:hypothetical protein FQN54_004237 [Arachnomyces sp. PD_36]